MLLLILLLILILFLILFLATVYCLQLTAFPFRNDLLQLVGDGQGRRQMLR